MMFDEERLLNEINFKATRSSGSGGQHMNKVSTKVELSFNVWNSEVFDEEQKKQLQNKLKSRISKDGILKLYCGESRSQLRNKEIVVQRFLEMLTTALVVQKKRKHTKIPKASIQDRLNQKSRNAEKKANRRKPDLE